MKSYVKIRLPFKMCWFQMGRDVDLISINYTLVPMSAVILRAGGHVFKWELHLQSFLLFSPQGKWIHCWAAGVLWSVLSTAVTLSLRTEWGLCWPPALSADHCAAVGPEAISVLSVASFLTLIRGGEKNCTENTNSISATMPPYKHTHTHVRAHIGAHTHTDDMNVCQALG